jgi:Zn-dependent peptidase ImmA (M78 family)/DNA-binding XRE family transcriptional regulator
MPGESFVGARLQLAREFRGLTQKQLGDEVLASHALISYCENGKKQDPTTDLVEAFAAVLGFLPGFFYRAIDDMFLEQECSFRHRRSTPERLKTQIRAHGTLIGMVIARLKSCLKFPALNVPVFRASTTDEIEAAAEKARRFWKLESDGPINQVGRVLERAGVVIVPRFAHSAKVDAFSRNGGTSIIFLNQGVESASRWIFDTAHECGHLVMHAGFPTGSVETETAADRFASAFLMPRRAFSSEFRAHAFSWQHVFALKRRWHVSAAAVVRRAYDLGLLGAVEYRQAYKYISFKRWKSKGEPFEPTFQGPELLDAALSALGTKVDLMPDKVCADLNFTPETFRDITGRDIPKARAKSKDVIPFPSKG